jgi:hypothetical protein
MRVLEKVLPANRPPRPGDAVVRTALAHAQRRAGLVTRADATIGTTGASGWGEEITTTSLRDFVAQLAPASAAAELIRLSGGPLEFGRDNVLLLPAWTAAPVAHWCTEGDPIPVTSGTVATPQLLAKNLSTIVPVSGQLLAQSNAEPGVRIALNEAVSKALDLALFGTAAASDARPAGLLNGVSALTGFPGDDATAMLADLRALVSAVAPYGSPALVMHPVRALALAVRAPSLGIPVVPTGHIAEGTVIALATPALAVAMGEIDIRSSSDATIHMDDEPLPIVDGAGTVADPVRSMFQTAAVAIRLILTVGWQLRAPGGVAWIEGAAW